jgi:transposase-like protein
MLGKRPHFRCRQCGVDFSPRGKNPGKKRRVTTTKKDALRRKVEESLRRKHTIAVEMAVKGYSAAEINRVLGWGPNDLARVNQRTVDLWRTGRDPKGKGGRRKR